MCEVTRNNFDSILPEIEYNLRKSTFISIDCEFSGIKLDPNIIHSLFDTPDERYLKLKSNLNGFIILQLGLSSFHYNRDLSQYDASAYKLHIFPRSFGDGIDPKFLSQASSFEFLCKFNFDFNKVFYDGLSYLNHEQKCFFQKKLEDKSLSSFIFSTLDIDEVKNIHEICNSFDQWVRNVSDTDVYSFTLLHNHERFLYALNYEIRRKFKNAWCFHDGNVIKLKLVTAEERQALENENKNPEAKLLNQYCGISRIFDLLVELKKPIIGHNLLLDLLILYNQFYNPLPDNLSSFKKGITKLFPSLYDTKLISYELQRSLKQNDKICDTSLSSVYEFVSNRGTYIAAYSPKIELKTEFKDIESRQIHDAGWDAYITGFSFVRLCHMIACNKSEVRRPLSSPEHLVAVEHLKNRVNLARAAVTYIDFDKKELASHGRPPLLYVSIKNKDTMDVSQLTCVFSKYGGFDVKPITNYSALIAVSNYGSANDILKDFYKHKAIKVERYTFFRHSQTFRYCLWAGIVVPLISLGICLTLRRPDKHS